MASLGREASQLTRKQVRNVVSTLETKRFFARATVCNRQTYYSHRLTEEKLRAELVKRFTERQKLKARADRDREMTKQIQQQSGTATKGTAEGQQGATEGPH